MIYSLFTECARKKTFQVQLDSLNSKAAKLKHLNSIVLKTKPSKYN